MGGSNDLQIYHDGSHSYIKDNGTGQLRIQASTFSVENAAGTENIILANQDGSVYLYNNNTLSLQTASDGLHLYAGSDNQNITLRLRPRGTAVYATLAFENSSNTGVASIGTHSGASTLYYVCATHLFHIGGGYKLQMSGNSMQPYSGVTNFDLGASGARFNNIYTSDLDLSNEAKGGNDVDGTWGSYTIQEGESDLFLINKRNGKKYKFLLKEVD